MRETTLWTLHLLAGIVILVFLSVHMGIMHLESILLALGAGYEHVLTWASVAARNKQLYFAISYPILLGAALYHGFYGLRNILLELNPSAGLEKAINWILVIAGVLLFIYGTWAAIAAYAL